MSSVKVDMIGVVDVGLGDTYLHVRDMPSMSGNIIGKLYNGFEMKITMQNGDWFFATNSPITNSADTGGWSHSDYINIIYDGTITSENVVTVDKEEQERLARELEAKKKDELNRQYAEIEAYLNETKLTDKEIVDSLLIHNLNGVYGIPYQFMPSVDPRLQDTLMGRKYSEKIISKMPLLCITPGKVQFMSNYSKEEQEGLLASLISGGVDTDISSIIKENGRYFTFAFDYEEYFKYVNGLCRAGARFLNIQNMEIDIGGTKAKASAFDWAFALNSKLKATLTSQEFIGFYMDSTDSVSEEFTNTTTQSQLSSTVNGMSDLAREVGFLLGAGAGKTIEVMDQAKLEQTMATIEEISRDYLNGSRLFKDIANNFATIATGGKLLFPEIWADSEFSKSFDVLIKLRTPDCDTVSWYINIYVPLCHLIALAAGHQTENANGYYSPFLIRAFYKGLFNVDMGIITNMSINKGKEAAWNIDGLPTEIDVNLTIKDLYNMLSIVPGTEPKNFVTNNILMDYIANLCGININQMDIERSVAIYYILMRDSVTDLPNNINRKFQDAIDTYGMNLYNAILNKFLI